MKQLVISILFISFVFVKAFSQIPNNDFESWTTTSGYPSPTDWGNLNQITSPSGIYTCLQGSPGYLGASYLYLMTKNVPGKGVVPGVAVCGAIDTLTYKAKSGFPFSARPQELSYYMQYMPYDPSDSSSVKVLLTKWNTILSKRDSIAYGESYFNGMAHTWIYRTTPLTYYSGDNPDSAIVVISSSDNVPFEYSYIYIDNLQFNGTVAGIDIHSIDPDNFLIYPNPTNGNFFIEYSLEKNKNVVIEILDVLGRNVYSTKGESEIAGQHKYEITSVLNSGIYTIVLKTENQILIKKIILTQ